MSSILETQGLRAKQETFKPGGPGATPGSKEAFSAKLGADLGGAGGTGGTNSSLMTSGSAAIFSVTGSGGMGKMASGQSGPAFGAGAIGLDGSSGLSGGLSSGGGNMGSAGTAMGSNSAIGSASGGDSQGALLNATKAMQETQMSFNLQYLQLQSQMQSENRSYTAVSNIMKTKHDTVKNSISNVR